MPALQPAPIFLQEIPDNWRALKHHSLQGEIPLPLERDFIFAPSLPLQDSRLVEPDSLYVAITCDEVLSHIQAACFKKPRAILLEEKIYEHLKGHLPCGIYILVPNSRQAYGWLLSLYYPQQPQHIYAVTGTNGKSSVTHFVQQFLKLLNISCGSLGTLGLDIFAVEQSTEKIKNKISLPKLTTPDAHSLHKVLQTLKEEDIDHFAFEASSHGIDQYRIHQAQVTVAAFTNLTQDHLDYHGTMEEYFKAKSRLFTEILKPGGAAIINMDSPYGPLLCLLLQKHPCRLITYGITGPWDIQAENPVCSLKGTTFSLKVSGKFLGHYHLPLVGLFQLENVLCTLAMLHGEGIPLEQLLNLLPQLKGVPGRMELVGRKGEEGAVFVDYAHTPDALERALQVLRSHLPKAGKLHVVFGCGGNRDVLKREIMGRIAQENAHEIYVTDDNPREESPSFIRQQILKGCPGAHEIGDRQEAIYRAIHSLGPQDCLLIAGKGHEKGQLIKNIVLPFDDVLIAREILNTTKGDNFK